MLPRLNKHTILTLQCELYFSFEKERERERGWIWLWWFGGKRGKRWLWWFGVDSFKYGRERERRRWLLLMVFVRS